MRLAPAIVVTAASAATSLAQLGTGQIWYEASSDNGTTWLQNFLVVGPDQTDVLVRLRASWSSDAGMYAFAGTQFDVLITEALADSVTDMQRPAPFNLGAAQTLTATHFGSTIKLDESRDTLGPGLGTRGVFPGQLVENFAGTNFTSDNPVTIFQFRLNFGDFTIRQLSSLYIAPSGGDTISRVMRVYTTPTGGQNTPLTTTRGMIIDNYTPTPGATITLALGGALACRRRRRGG